MRFLWIVALTFLLSVSTLCAAPVLDQPLSTAQLVRQFKAAKNDPQKMAMATAAIANDSDAIDAVMNSGNLSLINAYQKQVSELYSRNEQERQRTISEAEALVNNYTESVRNKSPQEQEQALQALAENQVALRILTQASKPILPDTPSVLTIGNDFRLDLQYKNRLKKAEKLIDSLKDAVATGDDVVIRAATLKVLDNREARFIMRDGSVDDATKTAYGKLADTYRTQPILNGTAKQLNRANFVVREANGVERKVTAADFKIGSKDPSKPGMDLDFYTDAEIIDPVTKKPISRLDIEKAMQKTAADAGINYRAQEINVTGMGSLEDLPLEPGETPAEFIARVKRDKRLSPSERQKVLDVIEHKLKEAKHYGAGFKGAQSSSLQHQAYVFSKEKSRFIDPLIGDKNVKWVQSLYEKVDPKTGLSGMQVIEKLAKGEMLPGTASAEFRRLTGGMEIEDAMNRIDDWGKYIIESNMPDMIIGQQPTLAQKQLAKLKNSKIYDALQQQWGSLKNTKVANVFQKQWTNLKQSKIPFGKGFNIFGEALGAVVTAGDFSKFLQEEMDRAILTGDVDTQMSINYALARTADTAIIEPMKMIRDLTLSGIEKGATKVGQGMESVFNSFKQGNYGAALYNSVAMQAQAAGWVAAQAEMGAEAAWEGLKYAASNPYETNMKVGEFLGLQAIGNLIFRETDTLMANAEAQRDQLRNSAAELGRRADQLQQIIADFKKTVRTGDPESKTFQRDVADLVSIYQKRHTQLLEDYVSWRIFLNKTYGGVENPLVAAIWSSSLEWHLAKVNALPKHLTDVIDANFIKDLLSIVRLHLINTESGEAVTAGGWLQFNSSEFEKVCRGNGPNLSCKDIPPGTHQMRVKVGDYEEVKRSVTINPLARRHYNLNIRLATEIPLWASITVNVIDVETQSPVPGAMIRFSSSAEKDRETTTSTGAIKVNQVLNGNVTIRASAKGYHSNQSNLHIDTTNDVEYDLLLALQPDGSDKKKAESEPEQTNPASGSFDCNQIEISTNVNFSTWSCCKDDFERTMVRSMCNSVKTQASSKKLPFLMQIKDSIRSQEGDIYNPRADYSDYPTPYGTLREVNRCADSKADDLCQRMGANQDAETEEDTKQEKTNACYEKKRQLIENAIKSNSDGNPNANVVIYATKACEEAYKKCKDRGYKIGEACRAKATNMQEIKACNPPVTEYWEDCALQEVNCSAAAIKQECGVEE